MEPEATRAALERVVSPRGRILVCRAVSAADDRNPWLAAYEEARRGWTETAGADRHGRDPGVFFAGTRFHRAGSISMETEQSIPVERLVERVLSRSSSSPDRLGTHAEAMRVAVLKALAPFAAEGLIREIVEARAEVFGGAQHGA